MNSTESMKSASKWYKWEVLALLWVAYLLNQGDRQVFNSVLPLIRDSLSLSDTSVSLIAVFFNLFYAVMVPIGGWMGDRFSRKWVTTLSILFWSIATMFTGLANGVFLLILTRSIATGGGEAFFGPANYSLLGQYHTDTRARAMSIHQTSYYVGVILAGWLAGYIGDHLGWQYAFYIFGGAGVVWAVVMALRLRDLPRGDSSTPLRSAQNDRKESSAQNDRKEDSAQNDRKESSAQNDSSGAKVSIWDGFRTVFTTPTALMVTLGFCGFIFVITGYMTWVPTFLQENFGQTGAQAGLNSMLWTYVAAFIGVLLAGTLSDRFAEKAPRKRMVIQGVGLILGAAFLPFMGTAKSLWVLYLCFAGWGFFRAFFDANIYAALYDVTPERLHASCSSAMIMTGFAVGATAPYILALIKEATGSLNATFPVLGVIWLVCGLACLWVSRRHYDKDFNKKNISNAS
ncbi:MAG: MFS transporter [Bacteroidales bacterium]|nr:MFS transporter [Bacteroidales bacterium]